MVRSGKIRSGPTCSQLGSVVYHRSHTPIAPCHVVCLNARQSNMTTWNLHCFFWQTIIELPDRIICLQYDRMHCLVVQGIAVLEINLALKTELVDRTEYIHIIFRYAHMLYLLVGYVSPRKPCVVSFYPCNRKSQDRNCPTDINTVYHVHPITSLFHITLVVSNPSVGMSEKGYSNKEDCHEERGIPIQVIQILSPIMHLLFTGY